MNSRTVYCEGKKVPDFQSKASKNGCIDVLFKSYKDAFDTQIMFEEKLKKLGSEKPCSPEYEEDGSCWFTLRHYL